MDCTAGSRAWMGQRWSGAALPQTESLFVPWTMRRPTGEELAARVYRRVEEENIWPVLQAEDDDQFFEAFARILPEFFRRMITLRELLVIESGSPGPEEVDSLVERAQAFGGEPWADAVADSMADHRRINRLFRRLDLQNPTPTELELLVACSTRLLYWSWCVVALGALCHSPERSSATAQEILLTGLQNGAAEAYIALRTIELQRQEAAEGEEEGTSEALLSPPLSAEERLLEADANAESIRLLEQVG